MTTKYKKREEGIDQTSRSSCGSRRVSIVEKVGVPSPTVYTLESIEPGQEGEVLWSHQKGLFFSHSIKLPHSEYSSFSSYFFSVNMEACAVVYLDGRRLSSVRGLKKDECRPALVKAVRRLEEV